jgi:NAD(P)-dependent dehydrogenase (short-subunit alcohol dehydrogenase family)
VRRWWWPIRQKEPPAVAQIQAQGGQSFWVRADVACEAEVAALVTAAVSTYGRLDIVVNNAGVVAVQTVEESSVEEWDRVMAVNVRSICLTTRQALPHLRAAGGGAAAQHRLCVQLCGPTGDPCLLCQQGLC